MAELHSRSAAITACVAAPDGAWVVSADEDATLRFWSVERQRCIETFHGDQAFTDLHLDASGGRLWALDRAGRVRVFDVIAPVTPEPMNKKGATPA